MTDVTAKYRELLEEVSSARAMSDEPVTRCIGRLTASDVIPAFAAFLNKEQDAGTKPTEILGATTWFVATVITSFTDRLPKDTRSAVLLDIASKVLATCLHMSEPGGEKDGN